MVVVGIKGIADGVYDIPNGIQIYSETGYLLFTTNNVHLHNTGI